MTHNGWQFQKQLQDTLRNGYDNLSARRHEANSKLIDEVVFDFILLAIGGLIYVEFDIYQIIPLKLSGWLETYKPFLASIGLAFVALGGIRLIVALIETAVWKIKGLFERKKD